MTRAMTRAVSATPQTIQSQVKLPARIAVGVVLQGIRIRFGRSLVTVSGVVLGIAFLMSILAGEVIRRGVAEEDAIRAEVRRMENFLVAETGPLRGKRVAWVEAGTLTVQEQRLKIRLTEAGALPVEPGDTGDVAATIFMGSEADPRAVASGVTAATRGEVREGGIVPLARELTTEEQARVEAEARRAKYRTGWIIGVSLLVTVIGISNAMLMSVTERFREIGTMKCLGALSSFIRRLFLIESSIVGMVGSVAGAVLGTLFSLGIYGVSYGTGLVFGSLRVDLLLGAMVLSIVAGVLLAVLAALYPAQVASRMVPAVALRTNV